MSTFTSIQMATRAKFVGCLLGTRAAGCVLEIVALVSFKLSFWQLFLGGSVLQLLIGGLFLWYSTNLARACFALANERYNVHW